MVHASKPRLINRVLDAVVCLCERKGSTARDILDFLRQTSKTKTRNLTMQVHRALQHAVNTGLLRHRGGRYKALFTLNPAPFKQLVNETNDERSMEGTSRLDARSSPKKISSDDKDEKRDKQRYNRKRKRGNSRQRRRRRRSESRKRHNPLKHSRGMRELKYEEKEEEKRLPRYNSSDKRTKPNIRNDCRFSPNRERSKGRRKGRTNYSVPPNGNYCDDKNARGEDP